MLATRDLLSQTFYRSEGFAKFAGKGICLELPFTKKRPAFFTGLRFTFSGQLRGDFNLASASG
jgi:hypothetical protein